MDASAIAKSSPLQATRAQLSQPHAGPGTYAGLFLVALSTLMYEILLTRIFSVTMWYHFAFVAISVALFGMTIGGLIVYLIPDRFPGDKVNDRLIFFSLLFAVSVVLSFLTQLSIPFVPKWSLAGVYSIGLLYLVISVPFICSGVCVCLALTRFPKQVSRLYAADLVGAAVGAAALVWLLNVMDAPSATARTPRRSSTGSVSLTRKPLAPTRSASNTYSSRSKVVSITMRTRARGGSELIWRAASRPSQPGMRMSMPGRDIVRSFVVFTKMRIRQQMAGRSLRKEYL